MISKFLSISGSCFENAVTSLFHKTFIQLPTKIKPGVCVQVKASLEDKIGATLSTVVKKVIGPFQFSTFNVSELHLKVDEMRVLTMDDKKDTSPPPIKMDVGLTLKGPVDVGMAMGISTIHLTYNNSTQL